MSATRLPTTVQQAPFGTTNNGGRRRPLPKPIVLQRGPAQGLEQTGNRQIDSVQQRVATASRPARANPLLDGNLLVGITLTNSVPVTLQHGLGRAFVSCMLMGQSASGSISVQRPSKVLRPLSAQNELDERQITITPTFTGVGDLWVF